MVEYFVEACVARGIEAEQFNLAEVDIRKLATALVDAAAIVLGSPMVHGGPHPKAAYAAMLVNLLQPKARYISVIGSFGWGGRLVETYSCAFHFGSFCRLSGFDGCRLSILI